MYRYRLFPEYGILFVRFSDPYIGAAGDNAILEICRQLSIEDLYSIRAVVFDLTQITSCDLTETDRARVAHFERTLLEIFTHPDKDPVSHISSVRTFSLPPENPAAAKNWKERQNRLRRASRHTEVSDWQPNLQEILATLNLEHGLETILSAMDND